MKNFKIHLSIINFLNYLLIANFFAGAFVYNNGAFDFYISYIFLVAFLAFYIFVNKKILIGRNIVFFLICIFFLSLFGVVWRNNSFSFLIKTMLAFCFYVTVYYLFLRMNDFDINKLFHIYMRLACMVVLIGIFQEISYFLGFEKGYDFRYFIPRIVKPDSFFGFLRVTSILQEPAHFGAIMSPALFVSILNIIEKRDFFIGRRMSVLIVVTVLLTFSLVAYLGIFVSLIIIAFNCKKFKLIFMFLIMAILLIFVFYQSLPFMIKLKIDQTAGVVFGGKGLEGTNLTTFAFCSNGLVAFKSFLSNPLIGSGLGSHPVSYDRYISEFIDPAKIRCPLNRMDAAGLFFRILSEMGMLGVIWFFWFIVRFYVSKTRHDYLWVISNAILCLFVLNLVRQGNYFYGGFIFFVMSYYFVSKNISVGFMSKPKERT